LIKKYSQLLIKVQGLILGLVFFALALESNAAPATVQSQPDAGQILNEIERDLKVKPQQAAPKAVEEAPEAVDENEQKVVIKHFKFKGNHVLVSDDLEGALSVIMNREITIKQLKGAVDIISSFYREHGYVAVATLPDQDITEGEVEIDVVEAVFGGVKFDGSYGKDFNRVKPNVIEKIITHQMPKDQPLNQDQLDRGLLIVNDLPGVKVEASLAAGEAEGQTVGLLKVKDQPIFSTSASDDNSGSKSTGRNKYSANASLFSPLHLGDLFAVNLMHSDGTDYGRLSYSLPVGGSGLILGVNASYMHYDIILSSFASTLPQGRSSSLGLEARYPILRSNTTNLNFSANLDQKNFYNTTTSGVTSDYTVNVVSATLSADRTNTWLSGGQDSASINLGVGNVDLNGSPNQSTDAGSTGPHTDGGYARLKWNADRNQFLTDMLNLNLNASGQFASKNLDSSEKFYLGGASGVRAYPTNEGGGSDGYLLSAELRRYLPYDLSLSGFVDYGHVKQFIENAGQLTAVNNYDLKGYGASLGWQGPHNTNLKLTWSHRIGENPNPIAATGKDQDGSLNVNQLWFSASIVY